MKKVIVQCIVIAALFCSSCSKNHVPEILEITKTPDLGIGGTVFNLSVQASDPDGDLLTYIWSSDKGEFGENTTTPMVQWTSPYTLEDISCSITVLISDGIASASETIVLGIEKPKPVEFEDPRDGTMYSVLQLGTQIWMAENLAFVSNIYPSEHGSDADPCYYVYGYDGWNTRLGKCCENFKQFGVLYNWEAALTACPDGWHLPTDEEWQCLEELLGMMPGELTMSEWRESGSVGYKLKSSSGWINQGNGNNLSGLCVQAGGCRFYSGGFDLIGESGGFWTGTESGSMPGAAWFRIVDAERDGIYRNDYPKSYGFSVRCVKDQ